MKIKVKYLKPTNDVLREEDVFLLVEAEDYNGYDKTTGKSTGTREGTRFTVLIDNPEKEINCEKLEVKPPFFNILRLLFTFISKKQKISRLNRLI